MFKRMKMNSNEAVQRTSTNILNMANKRVCLIGAGPSGMSVLYQYNKLREQGKDVPEIVCYDKQSDWGGLWLYSWMTGIGQYGETVHGSMYRGLWSNGPKECLEFPDYTFEDHFKRAIPSYPPREVLYDYLKGRWSQSNLRQWIHFNHAVRHVTYNDETDDFTVLVKNLPQDKELPAERFDYVIVASGHFSVPYMAELNGIETFPGRVIHSHDFRNSHQFKDQTVLVVGSSYSAEDLALQNIKYGAKKIYTSYRSAPMGFKWPPEIEERPLVKKIEGTTIRFIDGSSVEVDSIILCTGYLHCFPFMEERLRLQTKNVLYPPGLYKGVLWCHGGNDRVLYIGMQDQWYTFTMFDAEAKWAVGYITGEVELPDRNGMEENINQWTQRMNQIKTAKDAIMFQTDYTCDVAKDAKYGYDLEVNQLFFDWKDNKVADIMTYRDKSHVSKFTGVQSPVHHSTFMDALDDSMETYINGK